MNSKNKIGVLSILLFGVMMLFIPAPSIANAQEYDSYYEQDQYYDGVYRDDKYVYEEYYYPPKDKKMKEPPMLLVKKDVLYCDRIANGTFSVCSGETSVFPGPNSERHVQECNATTGQRGIVCDTIDETTFNLVVSDNIEFPGSEEGTKLNLNGERYTVTEKDDNVQMNLVRFAQSACNESGYDDGIVVNTGVQNNIVFVCVFFEGECSGIIQDGEIKECTVKNYVQSVSATS